MTKLDINKFTPEELVKITALLDAYFNFSIIPVKVNKKNMSLLTFIDQLRSIKNKSDEISFKRNIFLYLSKIEMIDSLEFIIGFVSEEFFDIHNEDKILTDNLSKYNSISQCISTGDKSDKEELLKRMINF